MPLAPIAATPLDAQRRLTPFQAAKARALLDEQLPCLGCHAVGGRGGRIGPGFDSVGAERPRARIARMIGDPQRERPGSRMPRTPLDSATVALLADYIADLGGASARGATDAPSRAALAPTPATGAALYLRHCAACHGPAGQGDGPNARHLPVPPTRHASAEAMSRRADDALFDVIAAGGHAMGRSTRMPAYGQTLTAAEIRELVRHLRVLCRCEQVAWARP